LFPRRIWKKLLGGSIDGLTQWYSTFKKSKNFPFPEYWKNLDSGNGKETNKKGIIGL
jgi:hypothetical protein